jgi:hypothetical protein
MPVATSELAEVIRACIASVALVLLFYLLFRSEITHMNGDQLSGGPR